MDGIMIVEIIIEEVMDIKVVAAGVSAMDGEVEVAMDGEVEVAMDGDEEVLN